VDLRAGHTAEEAEEVILDTLAAIAEDGVSDAELQRAANRLETRFYRGLQTAQQRAQSIGYWEATTGDFRQMFAFVERYKEVTVGQIVDASRRLLLPERRNVVIGRAGVEAK